MVQIVTVWAETADRLQSGPVEIHQGKVTNSTTTNTEMMFTFTPQHRLYRSTLRRSPPSLEISWSGERETHPAPPLISSFAIYPCATLTCFVRVSADVKTLYSKRACVNHWDEWRGGVKGGQTDVPFIDFSGPEQPAWNRQWTQTAPLIFVSNVCTENCSHHAGVPERSESSGYDYQHITEGWGRTSEG